MWAMRKAMSLRGMVPWKRGGGRRDGDGTRRDKWIGSISTGGADVGVGVAMALRMMSHRGQVSSNLAPKSLGAWSKGIPSTRPHGLTRDVYEATDHSNKLHALLHSLLTAGGLHAFSVTTSQQTPIIHSSNPGRSGPDSLLSPREGASQRHPRRTARNERATTIPSS